MAGFLDDALNEEPGAISDTELLELFYKLESNVASAAAHPRSPSSALSLAQLTAAAVLPLVSQSPDGPPNCRLNRTSALYVYCSKWAREVTQQSLLCRFGEQSWWVGW